MKQIRLTITELAGATGSSCKRKQYDLKSALSAIYSTRGSQNAEH